MLLDAQKTKVRDPSENLLREPFCNNEFNAVVNLIKTFNLPASYISKTKAQLSAIILGCNRHNWDDEFDITIVPTLKITEFFNHNKNGSSVRIAT